MKISYNKINETIDENNLVALEDIHFKPYEIKKISFGLTIVIPENYRIMVHSTNPISGLTLLNGIELLYDPAENNMNFSFKNHYGYSIDIPKGTRLINTIIFKSEK